MQCFFHIITTKAAAALQTAAADFKLRKGEESLLPPGLHAGIIWRAICKEMVRGKPHTQHQRIKKAAAVFENCRSRLSAPKAAAIPYLQDRTYTNRLSRYPDSRIRGSQQCLLGTDPMAGFRLLPGPPRSQWRYRSGVSPDSLFSPRA